MNVILEVAQNIVMILIFILIISHVLIFFFGLKFVDWKKAKSRGHEVSMLIYGNYQYDYTKEFIKGLGVKLLPLMCKIRGYALFSIVIALPVYFVLKTIGASNA